MTFYEICKSYFPDYNDDDIDWLIWSKTGYPCWWAGQTHLGTSDPETVFRRQLMDYKLFLIRYGNVPQCDFCDKPAVEEHANMQCQKCGDEWNFLSRFHHERIKISKNREFYRELAAYLRD